MIINLHAHDIVPIKRDKSVETGLLKGDTYSSLSIEAVWLVSSALLYKTPSDECTEIAVEMTQYVWCK